MVVNKYIRRYGLHILVEMCIVFRASCSYYAKSDEITDVTCESTQVVFANGARSNIDCVMLCDIDGTCRSTFWSPASGRCVGCRATYEKTVGLPASPGTKYFQKSVKMTTCTPTWTPFKGSCYKLITELMSWNHASGNCRKKGANLVAIETEEEMDFIHQFYNDKRNGVSYLVWIGASVSTPSPQGPQSYTWPDGSPLSDGYVNFRIGNVVFGPCVYLNTAQELVWETRSCRFVFWSVCEIAST